MRIAIHVQLLIVFAASVPAQAEQGALRPLTVADEAARRAIGEELDRAAPAPEAAARDPRREVPEERKLVQPEHLQRRTVAVDGREREYFVFIPEAGPGGTPLPVVFALHGGSASSGLSQHFKSDYTGLAAREGFAVVYPSGIKGWNYNPGGVAGRDGERKTWEDLAFFDAMFEELVVEGVADPDRIYVTGGSAGGMMTWSLMHHRGDRIAAVGIMVATLPSAHTRWPAMPRAIPTLLMLGTLDPLVTWDGSDRLLSAADTLRFICEKNGCVGEPELGMVPDRDPGDGIRVETATWSGTEAPVVFYRMNGHGHGWPMVENNLTGPKTKDLVPIEEFWPFLRQHSLE